MKKDLTLAEFISFKKMIYELWPKDLTIDCPEDLAETIWQHFESLGLDECKNPHVFVFLGHNLFMHLPSKPPFNDPLDCYNRALELLPTCAEALRSKGYYLDILDEEELSIECFQMANEVDYSFEVAVKLALMEKNLEYSRTLRECRIKDLEEIEKELLNYD